jgi:hypothetical protein
MEAFLNPQMIMLLNSSIGTAGKVVNEIPVNLLRAMEALIAVLIPGKAKIKTKYLSLSITYIDRTFPPNSFTRLTTSALYFTLISFSSGGEDFPKIKNVFILPLLEVLAQARLPAVPPFEHDHLDKRCNRSVCKEICQNRDASSLSYSMNLPPYASAGEEAVCFSPGGGLGAGVGPFLLLLLRLYNFQPWSFRLFFFRRGLFPKNFLNALLAVMDGYVLEGEFLRLLPPEIAKIKRR